MCRIDCSQKSDSHLSTLRSLVSAASFLKLSFSKLGSNGCM